MALRPFHSGAAALRITAVILSCARNLYGHAPIIFFSVYISLYMKMFRDIGYKMYHSCCSLIWQNEEEILNDDKIIKFILITIEDLDLESMLYKKRDKLSYVFFNFIEKNSNINIVNKVIKLFEKYCKTEILYTQQLAKTRMIDMWLNFYIILMIKGRSSALLGDCFFIYTLKKND